MLNCAEQVQRQNYKTHAYRTLKTAAAQTIMLKHKVAYCSDRYTENRDKQSSFDAGSLSTLPVRVTPADETLILEWLPCRAPGIIGSVVGSVGLASVYCDRVR